MEKYLGKIIKEHEFAFRMYESIPKLIDASKLLSLTEYTDKRRNLRKLEKVFLNLSDLL